MPFSFTERMTTLLQEFEEWLRDMKKDDTPNMETVGITIQGALDKLEELKKKYNVTGSKT